MQLDIGSIKSKVKGYKNLTHTVAETVNVRENTDIKSNESVVNSTRFDLAEIELGEYLAESIDQIIKGSYTEM